VIITCEQCGTRFHLDDGRVPESGVRVRCSRCEYAFFVKRGVAGGDPVEGAVAQALAVDAAESGQGLEPEPEPSGEPAETASAAAAEPPRRPTDAEEGRAEESDWQFNHEPSDAEDAELAAAREAVDDLLSADPGSPDTPGDPLFDTDPGVDDDIDALLDGGGAPLPGLDGSSAASFPAGPELEEGFEAHSGPEFDPLEGVEAWEPGPAASDPTPEPRAAEDELGSPENWDFFAEEAAEAAPRRSIPLGRIVPSPAAWLARSSLAVESVPAPGWLRGVVHGAGWIAVAVLTLAMLRQASPGGGPAGPATTSQTAGAMSIDSVSGRWVENAVSGPLYVISGELRSTGPGAAAPSARLKVRLLDAEGRVLIDDAGELGPALPRAQLRETDPRLLHGVLERGAVAMAGEMFTAAQGRPVQAILTDVPAAARGFEIYTAPLGAAPLESESSEPTPAPEAPRAS